MTIGDEDVPVGQQTLSPCVLDGIERFDNE